MYLDPAFGGMLLQVIIAIVAVGGGIIYSFRRNIKALFSKNKTEVKKRENKPAPGNALGTIDEIDIEEDKEEKEDKNEKDS